MSTPIPGLAPVWTVVCARCEEHVELARCQCPIIRREDINSDTGWVLAATNATGYPMHEHGCQASPPERCPRCKAVNWLRPRAYVRGQGTSRATLYRRKAARAARRARRRA